MRIAVVTEIPAPFRTPLFNALAREPGVELRVIFLSASDPRRPHYRLYPDEMAFDWVVAPGLELRPGGRWVVLSRGVARRLLLGRPDVIVVGGWNQPAFWQALAVARLRRVPVVAWVESTARDARSEGRALERAKRALIARCAGFIVPGGASREYLESLGVASDRIAVAPNAVDLGVFRDAVATARRQRDDLRRELGLTGCTVLYVGRLDPEKGVDVLLDAVAGLDLDLVVVGAGAEEQRLRAAAPPNARFTGALERDALVPWYAAADVFALPSRSEQWGMVLNEAAAAGLPIVASEAAGAAWDVLEDGVSGFRVPAGDAGAFREALSHLASDAALCRRAGLRSAELAATFTAEAWATAVAAFARRLTRDPAVERRG